jgi:hypothetical protein
MMNNLRNSDGFAAQSHEEYDGHAGEGPLDTDGYNGNQSEEVNSDFP